MGNSTSSGPERSVVGGGGSRGASGLKLKLERASKTGALSLKDHKLQKVRNCNLGFKFISEHRLS